jgi:hypothetical protein
VVNHQKQPVDAALPSADGSVSYKMDLQSHNNVHIIPHLKHFRLHLVISHSPLINPVTMAPRSLFLTVPTTIPMAWTIFRVKRELFENLDKIGFFHIEGDCQGVSYQLIWNTHEQASVIDKKDIIKRLSMFAQDSRIDVKGNWHILTRVIGSSVTNTVTVLMKEFRISTVVDNDNDFGVPRSSVFVKHNNDDELLLRALETQNEARKAKLRVEDGVHADIIERLIPSKRAADEEPRNNAENRNGSQPPAPGSHSGENPPTRSRTDGHGNGAGSSQSQNVGRGNTPPVQAGTSASFAASQQEAPSQKLLDMEEMEKLGSSPANPISLEDEEMPEQDATVPGS